MGKQVFFFIMNSNGSYFSGPTLNQNDQSGGGFFERFNVFNDGEVNISNLWALPRQKMALIAVLLGSGFLFFILGFMSLPWFLFTPKKVNLLFTVGSILIMNGIACLIGYVKFIKNLSSWSQLPFTLSFLLSTILTVISIFYSFGYIPMLVLFVVQFLSTLVFMLTYLPGGKTLINVAKSGILGRSENILPF